LSDTYLISENDFDQINKRSKVDRWDILFSMIGTVGEIAFVKNNEKYAIKNVGLIKTGNERLSKYLFYYLWSPQAKADLESLLSGSTQKFISLGKLREFPIFLPKELDQTRIASVLSAYDDLIENNEKRIKALEEMAQLLYTEWFVKFKFPGHEKVKMVESGTEYGLVPEGWKVRSLGDDIELGYGKALKKEDRIPGKILVCGSGGVVGTHNEKLVSGPGIVIGRKGNAGAVFWVNSDFYPIDTAFFVKTKLDLAFAFYLLRSQNFVLGDAAVPGLNREQAYRNKILIPDAVLIDGFSKKADPIRKLIGQIVAENLSLSQTRDLLIPQLVTGKREVK